SSIRYLTSSLAYHADMLYFESTIASVFFHDTATTDISTLSLHDALPILFLESQRAQVTLNSIGDAVISTDVAGNVTYLNAVAERDRKSTRLNSSHVAISYAVFCLKKKKFILSLEVRQPACTELGYDVNQH